MVKKHLISIWKYANYYYIFSNMSKKMITNLSYKIMGLAIEVHKELGPGLLECIYEKCLFYELQKNGFNVINQLSIPIKYKEIELDSNFRLDLLVNDLIIIEIKSVSQLLPIHQAQLLTYMKLLKKPQGLLLNFDSTNLSKESIPLINDYFNEYNHKLNF
jgi:GxxExxY protein